MAKVSKTVLIGYLKCPDLLTKWINILDSHHHKNEGDIITAIDVAAKTITLSNGGVINYGAVEPHNHHISEINGLEAATLNGLTDLTLPQKTILQNSSLRIIIDTPTDVDPLDADDGKVWWVEDTTVNFTFTGLTGYKAYYINVVDSSGLVNVSDGTTTQAFNGKNRILVEVINGVVNISS